MNMVCCGEDCRFQVDGYCTRHDLTLPYEQRSPYDQSSYYGAAKSECCYFEQR